MCQAMALQGSIQAQLSLHEWFGHIFTVSLSIIVFRILNINSLNGELSTKLNVELINRVAKFGSGFNALWALDHYGN